MKLKARMLKCFLKILGWNDIASCKCVDPFYHSHNTKRNHHEKQCKECGNPAYFYYEIFGIDLFGVRKLAIVFKCANGHETNDMYKFSLDLEVED